jgi:alkylhydroperoxidase/carboxymuconolactone decarboxylase family protein YurZ
MAKKSKPKTAKKTVVPRNETLREKGLRTYKELGWGINPGMLGVDDKVWELITDFIAGSIWSRPILSKRDRYLITLATLIAMGADGQRHLLMHALDFGFNTDELRELIIQVMYYAGQPRGLYASRVLREVVEARGGKADWGRTTVPIVKKAVKEKR